MNKNKLYRDKIPGEGKLYITSAICSAICFNKLTKKALNFEQVMLKFGENILEASTVDILANTVFECLPSVGALVGMICTLELVSAVNNHIATHADTIDNTIANIIAG